ncbi:MAG: ribonuclease Z [Promethearchaeia archaeon]
MKVTFLGTAGSTISAHRTYPSILINDDFLLDCGEGTTQKLVSLGYIDDISIICITHLHNDHFLGIFSLLWYWYINQREKPLHLISPPNIQKTIEQILDLTNTPESMRKSFEIHYSPLKNIEGMQKLDTKYKINALKMEHLDPTFGFRISHRGRIVAYSGDSRPNENLVKLAKNCNLLIGEATYSDSLKDLAEEHFHSTPSQMARVAQRGGCKKLALVHISPFFHGKLQDFQENAAQIFKGDIIIPQDLDVLEL